MVMFGAPEHAFTTKEERMIFAICILIMCAICNIWIVEIYGSKKDKQLRLMDLRKMTKEA
ncbi:hypothetical protein V1478_008361 [Vespula squamosa]|uniref:Uncharacterized protein n=1 Tax=Vespula squamosa TaxID=30214 RepID=A0ABD2ATA3_VESSQ